MRNPLYERTLEKQGVKYRYEAKISEAEIDMAKGLANQARLSVPLDEHLVEQYVQAWKEGAEFPPLVLAKPGRGKYVPLDGNHRLAGGKKAGIKYYDAYVIECTDPMVIDRIAWSFNNAVNGQRLSYEDSLAHAVTFVRKYGVTAEVAAKEWGVPRWAVSKDVKTAELRDILDRHNVKRTAALSDEALYSMQALATLGEDIFVAAAQVVASSGVPTTEVAQLTKRIRQAKTHAAKLAEVQSFGSSDAVAARRAETKGGTIKRRTPLPRERLNKTLREVSKILEDYPDKRALLPPDKAAQQEFRRFAANLAHRLVTIFGLGTMAQLPEEISA